MRKIYFTHYSLVDLVFTVSKGDIRPSRITKLWKIITFVDIFRLFKWNVSHVIFNHMNYPKYSGVNYFFNKKIKNKLGVIDQTTLWPLARAE
jgi:hypothetical protein